MEVKFGLIPVQNWEELFSNLTGCKMAPSLLPSSTSNAGGAVNFQRHPYAKRFLLLQTRNTAWRTSVMQVQYYPQELLLSDCRLLFEEGE